MRSLLLCSVLVTSVSVAQLNPCLTPTPQIRNLAPIPLKQSPLSGTARSARMSPFQPAMGVSQYVIDGQSRTAPSMGVRYVPRDNSSHKLIFSAGLLWNSGSSAVIADPRLAGFQRSAVYTPAQSYGDYLPSVGIGYLGAQYRYYLLQGDFQPYVGVGAQALGWRVDTRWGGTVAPNAVAGLSARISNVFDGFVEVQHAAGVGNLFGGSSSFGGITSVSFGFAFAPQFSRW